MTRDQIRQKRGQVFGVRCVQTATATDNLQPLGAVGNKSSLHGDVLI